MKKSIIIPTMWIVPKALKAMLDRYEKSKYIKEIILIDNNPELSEDISEFKKIRYYPQKRNIYVNPSWNLGVELAKYDPIIANDDIEWRDVDYLIEEVDKTDYDLIGASRCRHPSPKVTISPIDYWGGGSVFGSLMFIKNYIPIPDDIKIWYGDNWLFSHAKNPAIFKGIWFTNQSATINYMPLMIGHILDNDKKEYYEFKKKGNLQ